MLKRSWSWLSYFIANRPLCMITVMLAVFNLAFGIGFIFGPWEIMQTLIYQNIAELTAPWIFGWVITAFSLATAYFGVADRTRYTRIGLNFFALFWLFGAITYVLGGNYLLMVAGLMFSALPGYIAYYYKYRSIWDAPKEKYKRLHGLA